MVDLHTVINKQRTIVATMHYEGLQGPVSGASTCGSSEYLYVAEPIKNAVNTCGADGGVVVPKHAEHS